MHGPGLISGYEAIANPNRRRNITHDMTYPPSKTASLPRALINISMMTVAAIIARSPLRAEVPPEVRESAA